MAAGLGFKTFTTGEVLTAGDVNGYLMQGINVFTNATARDAAITAPAEGQFAFTKDNNSLWYYDGAAWVASGATGDIEGVTAGVGISGGGTSGTVTVTNSMATAIDAKGDLVPGTGADTFARLAVGANDTVLTADSSTATGLKWAAATAGGKNFTLVNTGGTTLTGAATITISGITNADQVLVVVNQGGYNTGSGSRLAVRINGDTASNYFSNGTSILGASTWASANVRPEYGAASYISLALQSSSSSSTMSGYCLITGGNSSGAKVFTSAGASNADGGSNNIAYIMGGYWTGSGTISSISIFNPSGNWTSGTVFVYTSA
jgi:hypothetical protein